MNKIIEQSLAREIIRLSEESGHNLYCFYELNKKEEIVQTEAYSVIAAIKEILEQGVSISTIVEFKTKRGNQVDSLIKAVFDNTTDNKILGLFFNKMTEENLKELTIKDIGSIYNNCPDRDYFLTKIFSLGFDFKQGQFDEVERAMELDFSFFEACLKYKKDFSFAFKYEDGMTLDLLVTEEAKYLKENKIHSDNKIDGFIDFLKKAKDMELLKDSLTNQLSNSNKENKVIKKL